MGWSNNADSKCTQTVGMQSVFRGDRPLCGNSTVMGQSQVNERSFRMSVIEVEKAEIQKALELLMHIKTQLENCLPAK